MRRMSICVVGVPLPGKKLSALSTTRSLPSISRTLPLRTELAMIFTICLLVWPAERAEMSAATYSSGALAPPFSASQDRPPEPALMSDSSPWWDPGVYADRRAFLMGRARITAAIRAWFGGRDFVEAETAILQVSPGNEAHLHAFATELVGQDGARAPLYLHTSPEFACKKLLAAGEARLFTFARAFRNAERTALHHPEFTMLEWYRANEPYDALIADCAALLAV